MLKERRNLPITSNGLSRAGGMAAFARISTGGGRAHPYGGNIFRL